MAEEKEVPGIECKRVVQHKGLFGGVTISRPCNFEPRYNRGAASLPGAAIENITNFMTSAGDACYLEELFAQFREQTYICDVCIECGATAKREA